MIRSLHTHTTIHTQSILAPVFLIFVQVLLTTFQSFLRTELYQPQDSNKNLLIYLKHIYATFPPDHGLQGNAH